MQIANITIDCTNARELAEWYVDVFGGRITRAFGDDYLFVEAAGLSLGFQRETDIQPGKNRLHIDFVSDDMAKDVARCVEKGANHVADHEVPGLKWTTLSDPAGNVFDISQAGQ